MGPSSTAWPAIAARRWPRTFPRTWSIHPPTSCSRISKSSAPRQARRVSEFHGFQVADAHRDRVEHRRRFVFDEIVLHADGLRLLEDRGPGHLAGAERHVVGERRLAG